MNLALKKLQPRCMASSFLINLPEAMIHSSLKPYPTNSSSNTIASTLRTSKTWVLPARPKPGRRAGQYVHKEHTVDEISPEANRKVRNREAQRAFRERQSSQLQELQNRVLKLSQKCDVYKRELEKQQEIVKELLQEKEGLEEKVTDLEKSRQAGRLRPEHEIRSSKFVGKCDMCTQELCICGEVEIATNLLTPDLQHHIDTFKPMSAVPLPRLRSKRPRLEIAGNLPVFKRSKLRRSQQVQGQSDSSTNQDERLGLEVGDQGCGFCSESSTCLCKELETQSMAREAISQ
ncbi:LADA_0E12816g1_1 [Lachancea dasiensis]|uniref:LADA_0E12816g1_1 n=1 Tax=Lachancea dasiensis TaxID=1072105 RepID=A0A1G4JFF8_9SACH|nr:LADA_0E12816g1_1 [Lachancea dasiensis]